MYFVPVESVFSIKKSVSSAIAFVIPQERFCVRPSTKTGRPGIRNPATLMPSSVVRCARYQRDGDSSLRCVSFSSIAPPLHERDGATQNRSEEHKSELQ